MQEEGLYIATALLSGKSGPGARVEMALLLGESRQSAWVAAALLPGTASTQAWRECSHISRQKRTITPKAGRCRPSARAVN